MLLFLQVTKEEYGRIGSVRLVDHLMQQLQARGKKPYHVPLGGSNWLGTWGYLQAVQELIDQISRGFFTDIVMVSHALALSDPPRMSLRSACKSALKTS